MSAPSSFAKPALLGVARGDDQWAAAVAVAGRCDGCQRQQADSAGTDDHRLVTLVAQRGMRSARGRLDHHRGLVAEVVGDLDQLAGVRDHPRAPTRRRCRCRSRSASPGSRCPNATRSHRLVRRAAHCAHTGLMPRVTHDSTGTKATRRPRSVVATTS